MGRERGFAKLFLLIAVVVLGFAIFQKRKSIEMAWARWNMTPVQRGMADMQRMRFDLAQKSFEKAVADRPDDPQALYSLAWALQAQGMDEAALAQYARAIPLSKAQPGLMEKIFANSGAIYVKRHDLDSAVEAYKQALSLNPNQTDTRYQYGLILSDKGLMNEALEQFQMVAKLDATHAAAASQIARITSERQVKKKTGRKVASVKSARKKKPAATGAKKPRKSGKKKTK